MDYSKNTIRKRFIDVWREEAKKNGISQASFARKLGITPNQFKEILKRRQYVSAIIIVQLQIEFNVPPDWLLFGKGKSRRYLTK